MTLNVSLTPHLEAFIRETLSSGRFQSASEVVRTALRVFEEQEKLRALKFEALRHAIQQGFESGPSEPATPEFWEELRRDLRDSSAPKPDNA